MDINQQKPNKKLNLQIGASLFVLIALIGGFTYAFFNYTRTGESNTLKLGDITFETTQNGVLNLENAFPISSNDVENDTDNVKSVTIDINGSTSYSGGVEYLVSIDGEINNLTIGSGDNARTIPVSIAIGTTQTSSKTLGIEKVDDYKVSRGSTTSVFKKIANENLTGNDRLLVGYIASDTSIDGTITISAYFDKDKIGISDTYYSNGETPSSFGNDRIILTTSEWNALRTTNAISFRIKVEANEGIWVQNIVEPTPASCFTYTTENNEVTITDYDVNCGGTDVVIPDTIDGKNVTKIGNSSFAGKGINSVILPNTLNIIDDYAFPGNNIKSIIIPNNVNRIGKTAFSANNMENVTFGIGLLTIDSNGFSNNKLKNIILPESLNIIEDGAFSTGNIIESLIIPSSVTKIGDRAFGGCSITNLTIPNNVTTIGNMAFGSNPITTLNIDMSTIPANMFNRNNGGSGTGVITNLILGEHVTTIGSMAFYNNPISTLNIDMVTIPSNLFDPYGYNGNGSLENLTIGSNVRTINSNAFIRNKIANVIIPTNVETMYCSAFSSQQNSITTSITYENTGFACTE